MWVMAICALIGGVDQLAGNKFGLGRRFEDGFQLLGPTALSMAGLICITPLLSLGLEHTIVPLYRILHLDPGMLGGVLAIDMGGYQLADALAETLESGKLRNVALDTLEKEDVLYYVKRVGNVIANCQMAILRSFPNVILTPHNAFYTAVDVRQMTETSMEGAWALLNNLDSPHRPEVGGATPLTTLFGALRTPVRIGSARLTRGVSSK